MNARTVSVRRARVSDAEEIARLTLQLGYEVEPSAASARLSRILARPDQEFLVAEIDARPVGWVHAEITEYFEADAFVVIGGLVVDRDQRGTGIGRMLMDAAEKWARERGCSIVRLWSSAGREASHRFYERIGYSKIKTQFTFAKSLESHDGDALKALVPRIDG